MDISNALQTLQNSINTGQANNQRKPAFELNAPPPKAAADSYAQSGSNNDRRSNLPTFATVNATSQPAYSQRGQLVDFEA